MVLYFTEQQDKGDATTKPPQTGAERADQPGYDKCAADAKETRDRKLKANKEKEHADGLAAAFWVTLVGYLGGGPLGGVSGGIYGTDSVHREAAGARKEIKNDYKEAVSRCERDYPYLSWAWKVHQDHAIRQMQDAIDAVRPALGKYRWP